MPRWSLPEGYSPREWLKVGRISPTWYRRALAVLVTNGAVLYTLYGIGRLDLAFYALTGSMLVLYGHELDLPTRVRKMSGLFVGQAASLVLVCLVAAAHPGVPLLVLVGSVLAATQKLACEKYRVGPPRHVVLAFLDLGVLFAPGVPVSQLPVRWLTFVICGVWACAVVITPALWHSRGGRRPWSPGDPPVEADPQLIGPALRCLLGVAASGYAAELIGVGRPYWAMVTAAAVFVGTRVHHGQRAMQRTVGTLLGVGVFAILDPLAKNSDLALVTLVLITGVVIEVFITANYWLGTVWVTPMALLITSLPGNATANTLIGERLVDTLVGSLIGIAVTLLTDARPHPHTHPHAPA
ncbi:FUSC family protein [Actinospica durhamensis]|uniref:FUSC family protein n=1 Tax=Actinospica durhamensis TaxID=1508375 RepID=A0A941ER17_9ACTN|nr:FUSC family protein [Actinospica durhamensis]MBR7835536.1 FUSC family protein [Actinospica durhamensis]